MVTDSTTGSELRRFLKIAKDEPLPFAFNPGNDDDEHLFIMHRRKNAELLSKIVRKDGPGKRFTYGMLSVNGQVVELRVERPLPQLAKKMKLWFGYQKLKRNVKVLGPDGEVLEEDIEELPPDAEDNEAGDVDLQDDSDDGAGAAEADDEAVAEEEPDEAEPLNDAPAADPLREKWEAVAEKLGQAVAAVLGRGLTDDQKLVALWELAQSKAAVGDYVTGLKAVPPITVLIQAARAVEAAPPHSQEDPTRVKWETAAARITPVMEGLDARRDDPAVARILAAWDKSLQTAAAGKFELALSVLPKLVAAIKALPPKTPPMQEEDSITALTKRLGAMSGSIKAAAAESPTRHAEIVEHVRLAKSHLADRDATAGKAAIDALEAALANGAEKRTVTAPPPPMPETTATHPVEDAEEPTAEVDTRALARTVRAIWDQATGKVDRQLDTLFSQIRSDPSQEASMVSDLGLSAWSAGARSRLIRAILELENTPPAKFDARARSRAVEAFRGYCDFLTQHPAVEVLERNPWKVQVGLSTDLAGALKEMERTVSAA